MNILKTIPIKYIGELHDVRLINFSVDSNEIKLEVPSQIKIRDFGGKAMISMVDVKLKKMRPDFCPAWINFDYRHVAFRLLIDDSEYNNGTSKGIYFCQSFTDNPCIVLGGSLFTDYKLSSASISEINGATIIRQGGKYIKYKTESTPSKEESSYDNLKKIIGSIDRAYSLLGTNTRVTQIQREKWPIRLVDCQEFENTFFTSAKLEGAFRVFETIYYQWLPPKSLHL